MTCDSAHRHLPGELDAYVDLLKRGDGGRAFLRIMRGFELTREKRDLYVGVLGSDAHPVRVVWGDRDPALKLATHGQAARRAAGVTDIARVPGKHFLQEDQSPAIADHVARIAGT
jgi:haloalkane dehalogenase